MLYFCLLGLQLNEYSAIEAVEADWDIDPEVALSVDAALDELKALREDRARPSTNEDSKTMCAELGITGVFVGSFHSALFGHSNVQEEERL